jgi:hypothetical protein
MSVPAVIAPLDSILPLGSRCRPVGFTTSDQDEEESSPHNSPSKETERPLDIDDLLQVARLIDIIKRDGRLENGAEGCPDRRG